MALLGGAVVWPLAARAQEAGRVYRIAYLGPSPEDTPPQLGYFRALAKAGFVQGKNLERVTRGYGQSPGQFAETARVLVTDRPEIIICGGPEAGRAAQQATKTIPLLIITDDMVGEGFVTSIAHPGGNITGVAFRSPDLDGKRLEILLELIPGARLIYGLTGSDTANAEHSEALRQAAQARGIDYVVSTVASYVGIAPAIDAAKAAGAAGLNVMGSALLFGNRKVIFETTAALRVPAIYQWPENAREGGLIGYGPSITQIYAEQLSRLTVKILRGAKPGDLPVEQPDEFVLAVNLKVAKALGLTVPPRIVERADEVIE